MSVASISYILKIVIISCVCFGLITSCFDKLYLIHFIFLRDLRKSEALEPFSGFHGTLQGVGAGWGCPQ